MEFQHQQQQALQAVSEWLQRVQSGDKSQMIFRLFGYAGTGKTTLAKYFAEGIDGLVLFAAFTGKATHVLASKGCPNTQTIHRLIYLPANKSISRLVDLKAKLNTLKKGTDLYNETQREIVAEENNLKRPSWRLNLDSPLRRASLLVVDECSMVDGSMGEDIMSFGVPVLALGDKAQLPAIGGAGFFTEAKPDFMLTDIHRQARDNPIIELSRKVRMGERLVPGSYGDSLVTPVEKWDRGNVFWADQLLVGKNLTRRQFNGRYRELKGMGPGISLPQEGDRLVCLRNNHEVGLLNGSLWDVQGVAESSEEGRILLTLKGEEGQAVATEAHSSIFYGEQPDWHERRDADEFDYGYALTVHKAQGSQWDKVVLFDEWTRPDWRNWLYTGITRAAEAVQIVKL